MQAKRTNLAYLRGLRRIVTQAVMAGLDEKEIVRLTKPDSANH